MLMPQYNAIERLEGLRVSDVMTRDVTTIRSSCTIGEAAEILYNSKSTGAPVVDEKGRCIGVLSAHDFLRLKKQQHTLEQDIVACQEYQLVEGGPEKTLAIRHVDEESVREHMTAAVQSIDLHAPLLLAARTMSAEHIHRVVVLDEHALPIGIVTTLDITAALISAMDEQHRCDTSI